MAPRLSPAEPRRGPLPIYLSALGVVVMVVMTMVMLAGSERGASDHQQEEGGEE
jgi:hypothetical protein